MGEFETLNFSIGIVSEDIALFHALYRTSIKGRRDIISAMFYDDSDENSVHEIDDSYTSRVAEVFNVVLHSLGMSLEFIDEDEEIKVLSDDEVRYHTIDGKTYMCTDYQFYLIETMYNIRQSILDQYMVITKTELDRMIRDVLENKGIVDGYVKKDLLKLLVDSEDKIEEAANKIGDAVNEMEGIDEKPTTKTTKKSSTTSKSTTKRKASTTKTTKAKTVSKEPKKKTVASRIKEALTKK